MSLIVELTVIIYLPLRHENSQWSQFWIWISASCWMKFPVTFLRDPKHYCLQKIVCNGIQKIPLMLQVGDRVLCYQYTGDLYREHVVVPASNCFVLPSCMSYEDGAALAANYMTAYFCVLDIGHMRAGQSILISSCAGIIHPIATQIFMTCWTIKLCAHVSWILRLFSSRSVFHIKQNYLLMERIKQIAIMSKKCLLPVSHNILPSSFLPGFIQCVNEIIHYLLWIPLQ